MKAEAQYKKNFNKDDWFDPPLAAGYYLVVENPLQITSASDHVGYEE